MIVVGMGELFPTTQWTQIIRAHDERERSAALQSVLAAYWRPLYVYVRRWGKSPEAAEDAVQGFVATLLERDFLTRLTPERGRLRNFMQVALDNYLRDEHEKRRAKKRGGDSLHMDIESAEQSLRDSSDDPERAFHREWAMTVLNHSLVRLESEYTQGNRKGPADVLRRYFAGDAPKYADVAKEYGMTVPQVTSFVHRARKRLREIVLEEVRDTVLNQDDTDTEVAELLRILQDA